ncbi:putative G protein-coupled receptor GPR1 [Septoria linicola]|nr:putative G protein-coupled receptor GPR1 [Septoria linicola]
MLNAPAGARSLEPLPPVIHRGLSAVTAFGLLSLVTTAVLFVHLAYRLMTWKHRAYARVNQYVALLVNLIFADFQQALGFVLSLQWLKDNGIFALTSTCWTQAWFLNAGDVGSGIFTLAMACHLFADIVFDYRLDYVPFLLTIIGLWVFNYILATIGVIIHPHDFYMRAGMWCWINETYMDERLWFHYVWILLTEFAVVVLYTLMFVVLWRRIKDFFYVSSDHQLRAESAARTVIVYPMVYVICTLPAVVARLRIMTGHKAGYEELTFVGVMMTSNGWLDVLVYVFTRRSLIFGPAIQNEDQDVHGLDTFTPWQNYEVDEICDQLTDLSPGPLSRSDSKRPEMEHNSRYRHDSLQGLLPNGSPMRPQRVPGESFVEPRLPEVVRVMRSEGDLKRPALRFPRRRDPLQNVRNASADRETVATGLKFGHATDKCHDGIEVRAEERRQDSATPADDMQISQCGSLDSDGHMRESQHTKRA